MRLGWLGDLPTKNCLPGKPVAVNFHQLFSRLSKFAWDGWSFCWGGKVFEARPVMFRTSFQGHKLDGYIVKYWNRPLKTLHSLKLLGFDMLGPYFPIWSHEIIVVHTQKIWDWKIWDPPKFGVALLENEHASSPVYEGEHISLGCGGPSQVAVANECS